MDNQPRVEGGYHVEWSHGHMVWADACFQQILSANLLATMGAELGRSDEVADMREESQRLTRFVNECLWDDATAYYYDRFRDGRLNGVKSVGAYWALLAEAAPAARLPRFIEHLANPAEFNRPHRLPALSADHPAYDPEGGAWCGGVWPPTNYMVLRGLTLARCHNLAHAIAVNHVGNVTQAFQDTGTVWEFYAPESAGKGHLARSDLVGWSGLGPIAVLFEYVFGLRADVRRNTLVWDVRLLDAHGVDHYPFGPEGLLDLRCTARIAPAEKPEVTIRSNVPVAVELLWRDGAETIAIG